MIKSQLVQQKPIRPAIHCLRPVYAGEHIGLQKRDAILPSHNFFSEISGAERVMPGCL